MVVKVGRYRSRRRGGGAAVAGGGVVTKVLNQQLKQAVHEVKHAVHHAADHEPMEVLEAVQKHIPHHPEQVDQILREAGKNLRDFSHGRIPAIPNYTTSYPNLSGPDPMAFARHLRQKYFDHHHTRAHADHQRVAGGLNFKSIGDSAKALVNTFNPADSINQGMDQLDKINFKDTSARGMAKNALHGYSGFLHGQAAYSQATGLAVSPFSAMDAGIPTAGLMALGMAQNKFGDAAGALAHRI